MHADPLRVSAHPTKDFFITMLVRDIELAAAISDLVDNSVDAARATRPQLDFTGLHVRLQVNADRFRIEDNCGGMSADVARNYAFRFGRPEGMPEIEHSIGQFGVGMKCALFKLGTSFRVESKTENSEFVLPVDVDEFRKKDEWELEFEHVDEDVEHDLGDTGTVIEVQDLHDAVAEDLGDAQVIAALREDMRIRHQRSLLRGLEITLNDDQLEAAALTLLTSRELTPAKLDFEFEGESGDNAEPVSVALQVGVDSRSEELAGWYVFCNDRLVRNADQTALTGWGTRNGVRIPKFHNQYARFRGYAFFDSEDAEQLPWDTTKTTLNTDSAVYRQARRQMTQITRDVIDFLDEVERERRATRDADPGPLAVALEAADSASIDEIEYAAAFTAPAAAPEAPDVPTVANIHYARPRAKVDALGEVLGISSYRDASRVVEIAPRTEKPRY